MSTSTAALGSAIHQLLHAVHLTIIALKLAISRKLERYNGFIIQHIDNKTQFEEKISSRSLLIFLEKLTCIAYVYRWIYVAWTYVHRELFYHIWAVYQCVEL